MFGKLSLRFGIIGALALIIFLFFLIEGFKAMIPDLLKDIHTGLFIPIEWIHTNLTPPVQENHKVSFFGSVFILIIYVVFTFGLIWLVSKLIKPFRKNQGTVTEFKRYCEEELAEAIKMLEKHNSNHNRFTDEKVLLFMKAFEMEVKNVFKLPTAEIGCFWVVPDSNNAVKLIYLSDNYDATDEEQLIAAAMSQDDIRIADRYVKQRRPDGQVEQFAIMKNIGKFKLGFSIFIYKNDIMNEENLREFEQMTSYYLLLGFYQKFVTGIKRRQSVS